jgi:hypothetical protein
MQSGDLNHVGYIPAIPVLLNPRVEPWHPHFEGYQSRLNRPAVHTSEFEDNHTMISDKCLSTPTLMYVDTCALVRLIIDGRPFAARVFMEVHEGPLIEIQRAVCVCTHASCVIAYVVCMHDAGGC